MTEVTSKEPDNSAEHLDHSSEHLHDEGSSWLHGRMLLPLIFGAALTIRAAVGLHPYSGEGSPPIFGDFEAQRHWMEIAVNVPARDWYTNTADNDLSYWGLDYPPLSGYASWLAGHYLRLVEPAAVALRTSRGHESAAARAAMRRTVLVADAVVLFPALWAFAAAAGGGAGRARRRALAFAATVPALALVDHGHFQYNGASLGLFVAALGAYLARRDAAAAALFCLSVYFKQLGLYYALALLALHVSTMLRARSAAAAAAYAARVGGAVVGVTAVVFAPWVTDPAAAKQVLRRLFPVARGLYEDKVANVWCSLSVALKLQRLLPRARQVQVCAALSFVASGPFFLAAARRRRCRETLVLSTSGCALAVFLFGYQVHEKQILLPLVPLCLLFDRYPGLCMWMSLASSASLFPLLAREGLVLPYWVLTAMQAVIVGEIWPEGVRKRRARRHSFLEWLARVPQKLAVPAAAVGAALHVGLLTIRPPESAPHIMVLLLTSFSCAIFCGVYVAIAIELWT